MLVPEGLLMELGPAPGANWNFVLGHLQPVLGEHEPVSFLALSGAVPARLKQSSARARNCSALEVGGSMWGSLFLSRPL